MDKRKCRNSKCKKEVKGLEVYCSPECYMNNKERAEEIRNNKETI